jgi:hypothetical protein
MGVGGQRHAPAALSPGKARYTLYKTLGGPQGRNGRVRKILNPPGFDPRTDNNNTTNNKRNNITCSIIENSCNNNNNNYYYY